MELVFRADAGHAWLAVSMDWLRELGIADKVSKYSYRKNNIAYLEEDCDASLLINALREAGHEVTCREEYEGERSVIRSYLRYWSSL